MGTTLKLKPDLIPRTSFFRNLRSLLKSGEWDTIRRAIYSNAGHKCEICGDPGNMNCHEVWDYNDQSGVQKLVGLTCLCGECHEVHHIGLAQIRGREEQAILHMMKVNGVDRKTCENEIRGAFIQWKMRSSRLWKLEIGTLEVILQKAKAK